MPKIKCLLQRICKRPPPLVWQVQHLWRKIGLLDDSHTDKLLLNPYALQEARRRERWLPIVTEHRKLGVSTPALMSTLVDLNLTQRVDMDLLRQFNDAALRCFGKESRRWHALKRLSRPDWYGICGSPEGLSKQAADAIARFDQDRSTLKEAEKMLSECVAAIGEAKGNLYPHVSLEVVQIIDKRMNDLPSSLAWAYKLVCACDPDRASENVTAFKKAVAVAQRRASPHYS